MDAVVFIIAGILSVASAILVVTRKNPVYCTIYLVLFFTLVSLQFLILRSPLLAILQLLVYAGAIMVLFLFVIMLLNLRPEELRESVSPGRKLMAGGFSLLIFILLVAAIRSSTTVQGAPNLVGAVPDPALAQAGEAAAIGEALFTTHALAFEYSSILILVAIIGAIYLTKRRSAVGAGEQGGGAA
jgi:NADH-quinone oxidoreductase subunit J